MKSKKKNNTLFLIPETDLIASIIEDIRDDIFSRLKKHPDVDKVVLDAGGVEVVDSLGVNLIIGLFRQVSSESKDFEIINAGEKFQKVSNFFRFPSLFEVRGQEG